MNSKRQPKVKSGRGSAPGERRGGRQKGTPNKTTAELKTVILNAFDRAGGADYLVRVAEEDPRTFCTLLGKVLPMTVAGDPNAPLKLTIEWQDSSASD